MPLDDYGIPPEILAALKRRVEKEITPRPATSSPQMDRSISKLDKAGYRQEINAADIKPMNMTDYYAGSNTLGITNPDNTVRLNPSAQAVYPDFKNTQTLAHELTHVRQNALPGALSLLTYESRLPYEQRPSEEEAFTAGNNYVKSLPKGEVDRQLNEFHKPQNNTLLDAMPQFIQRGGYKDLEKYRSKER